MANGSRARGSTTARGYGADHQRLRKQWAPKVARGEVTCWRCGNTIHPRSPWDLGHSDDRTTWVGPEHSACNRGAAARKANASRRANRSGIRRVNRKGTVTTIRW